MIKEPKSGGPAFPTDYGSFKHHGMTMLDWFAGMALSGIMANPQAWMDSDGVLRAEAIAYEKANAMITEREGWR
jgi:hypothetical protein